jgi:ribosomal-protein-alanine N-acetyltransferase
VKILKKKIEASLLCKWLEVRASNARAQHVYETHGYRRVGLRKRYYPGAGDQREDAVVMSLPL